MRTPPWAGNAARVLAGAIATALLFGVVARTPAAWPLAFMALAPWLAALDRLTRWREALLAGLALSLAFVAAVFGWFGAAIGGFTGMGAAGGMLTLLALSPLFQPQILAFALVRHAVGHDRPALRAVAGAATWVACEALVPKLLGDTLGHALHDAATLRQAAELGGAAGLTVVLLLSNEAVVAALRRRRAGYRRWAPPLGAGAALVLALALFGQWRLGALASPPAVDAPTLRIAMVQANLADYERRRQERGTYAVVREVLDTHYALSMSAIREHGADALLWSETVYPTTFGHPRSADGALFDREIQGFVDIAGVPLLFGTYDVDDAGEYNAAVLLEPDRGVLGRYRKTHPFPLTESVPAWLDGPALRRLLPWAGGWKAGDGARVLPLRTRDGREVQVLPLVCLDDVRPQLALDGARLGAQAIVGMSNDSWFTGHPEGARLHLAVAAFRSIETRLPQIRVTTNGMSAVIDESGQVLVRTDMDQQAVLTGHVSARNPAPTLMVRWGDWVGRAGAGALLALGLAAGWRRLRRARPAVASDARCDVAVAWLPARWRWSVAALRLLAVAVLAWIAFEMATRIGWRVASLDQLAAYAMGVVAPLALAGALTRRRGAIARVEGDRLVLDARRNRTEIPLAAIAQLSPWRLPLPGPGLRLVLPSGRHWDLVAASPERLRRLLTDAGVPVAASPVGLFAGLAAQRAAARWPRWDHPLAKFGLFPLLPGAIAFHLHQMIAFGGPFGEWLSFGAGAWLSGLALWWGGWSLGLMLFAGALRIAIEALALVVRAIRPDGAEEGRRALEGLARAVFYAGVPAALIARITLG